MEELAGAPAGELVEVPVEELAGAPAEEGPAAVQILMLLLVMFPAEFFISWALQAHPPFRLHPVQGLLATAGTCLRSPAGELVEVPVGELVEEL